MKKVGHTSEFSFSIYWWTLKNPKNQNSEKIKKNFLEISSFYTCVPNTTTIWGTVPEIQSETNLFCDFGLFFALYPTPLPSPLHPKNPENQNFDKMKKKLGDAIILNLCNKNHNKMMYAYSDMECNRHNFYTSVPQMKTIWCMVPEISSVTDIIFCHSGLFFTLLYLSPTFLLPPPLHLTTQKIKILKN